jgi:uncharacterized protein DUF4118
MVRGPVLLDRIFALNTLAINAMVMGLVFLRAVPSTLTILTARNACHQDMAVSRKFVLTAFAVATVTIIELPESFDAPGKPFLLYFIMSALCALAFGGRFGLFAIAASSVLSALFFDPVCSFWVSDHKDLIDIIGFSLIGSASVMTLAKNWGVYCSGC